MGSAGDLSTGYILVPWSSWDQWTSVHDSIFSSDPSSVATALSRVSAWRSRGCLPIAIDITAAFVEIQQKDPVFREGVSIDALVSEEMLSMLYSMTIMRLVNGFVKPAHKKTGRSICELADAIGIPRMLVDIRHEASHRDLPSLPLVRMACVNAVNWLKCNYWEPQRNKIPCVPKEIRSKFNELIYYIKMKNTREQISSRSKQKRLKRRVSVASGCTKLSSEIFGKFRSSKSDVCMRRISKISKMLCRLYSACPSGVVSVFLEFINSHASELKDDDIIERTDYSSVHNQESSMDILMVIISTLSRKRPMLLHGLLKAVLEMIEIDNATKCETVDVYFRSSQSRANLFQLRYLCFLLYWIIVDLEALYQSGKISLYDYEPGGISTDKNDIPRASLKKFLRKCLTLSFLGNKFVSDSVLLLSQMCGENAVITRLRKLSLLGLPDTDPACYLNVSSAEEEVLIEEATEKLKFIKTYLRNARSKVYAQPVENDGAMKNWNVAKSWAPCPIGMISCPYNSTPILPILEMAEGQKDNLKVAGIEQAKQSLYTVEEERSPAAELTDEESPLKRPRLAPPVRHCWRTQERGKGPDIIPMDDGRPSEGRLLIDGIWKKVSDEELLAIQSNINFFC